MSCLLRAHRVNKGMLLSDNAGEKFVQQGCNPSQLSRCALGAAISADAALGAQCTSCRPPWPFTVGN